MARSGPVLYVHPYGHVLDELVPMGAVALMNRVAGEKRGLFAWELRPEDLAEASVLALDLHWYFSIDAVRHITRDARIVAPDLPIVVGGISASFYAHHLLDTFDIDYVVEGDGELAFVALVDALREGRVPPPLPNVWSANGPPPSRQPVPAAAYDANDYLTLAWFPSLAKLTRDNHEAYGREPFWGLMDRYHPYVPLNRGCRFPCEGCFGAYQQDVFGPSQIDRGAESLARLLDGVEAHPDYRFVNLTAGTEDMARIRAYRDVFARRRPLGVYVMHFCALPSDDEIGLFVDGFERACFDFTNPDDVPLPLRGQGFTIEQAQDRIVDIARLLDGNDRIRMGVSFMDTKPHAFKDRLRAMTWERLSLKENSEWSLPRPNAMTLGAEIPAYPVPRVERHGLTTIELRRREAAKAKQARGFEVVSEGHGRYIVARALAPGLHPVFEEAPMRHVDGRARSEVTLDDPALAAFADAFVADFRTYFVRRLDDVAVRVSVLAASPGTGELVALPNDAWGVDLGDAALRPSFDGVRLCWHGTVPAGAHGLLLRPIMQAVGGNEPFDPRALAGLVWRALTFHAPAAMHATVVGVFSQNHARLALHRGEPGAGSLDAPPGALLASRTWSPLHDHPPTPFLSQPSDDAMARAHIFGPPRNLVDVPWPSERWPRRVARALTGAASRALLQGELVVREASTRWVHAQFQLHEGALDAYVLPPGPEGCAWQGNHLRLVIQDREGSRSASGVLLIRNLTSVLDALDRHG